MPGCPQCGTPIQETWDWCEACGFDPEGLKPAGWRPPVAPHERPATAPRAAVPPPGFGDAPPGSRAQGRTTEGGYAAGGHRPPPYAPPPAGPGYAPGQFGPGPGPGTPYHPYGSPPPTATGGNTALKVIAIVGVSFVLLLVVLVGAVTLLGKNASTKFSRVATAIDDPSGPAIPTTTTGAAWQPWTSADGRMTVDFPGAPELIPYVPGPKVLTGVEAQFKTGVVVYDAGFIEFKPDYVLTLDEAGLRKGLAGGAGGFDLTIGATTMSNFAGITSMDAKISGINGGTPVQGTARTFAIGNRLYFAIAFSTNGSEDFARFADSLRGH